MNTELRIGISGWRYEPWRGVFYPEDLIQKKELYYASRQLNSIEINGSFYALQTPTSYQRWHDETPDGFLFSVKGPRYITHIKRLKDVDSAIANFFASGVLYLKQKLGPILWQFPPSFLFYEELIEDFFTKLPQTVAGAAKLSAESASREAMIYPAEISSSREPLRHCMEVRHHSFENPDFIDLLRKHNVALVFADTAGKWPYMEDFTSDFLYLRLHGEEEIYRSGYDEDSLQWWAHRIRLWREGKQPEDALTIGQDAARSGKKDIYIYFDNDVKVRAPFDAVRLREILQNAGKSV